MSLRVVHTFGRNAGATQVIAKPVVRFGRAPENDVVFDPNYDRDASGNHAEARLEGGAWVLVDLGSRNGTFVRGERVSRRELASGDEVMFGAKGPRVRLEFAGAQQAAQPAPVQHAAPVHHPAPVQRPSAQPPAPAQYPAAPPAQYPAAPPAHYAGAAAPQAHAPQFPSPAAPPAGAPVVDASGQKRVGNRTIAMMVSSAVAAASGRSRPRKTAELSALVDQHVSAATAGQRRTTYVLAGLLIVALMSLGGLIFWSQQSTSDIADLREKLARLPPEDPRRREIESRLGTLHPSNANFGRNLYERTKKGIFMLASGREGFCTAFAVRPSVLATNAHCIAAARKKGGRIVALENEGRGEVSFSVSDMRPHPAYREGDANSLTPDVGIITIAGRAAVVLEIASAAELQAAGAGDDVYLIGFPGRLMDAQNPSATFLAANIGRITASSGRPGVFAENWLIQHDASTTQGTSGSPVFNGRGKVIAVNAGGYTENDDETIAGRKTEVVRASPYKFGMRVDLLDVLLR
ncbi:MAG TPA: FHA domain-containing protein [Polyangiaceae bacterium]|nr:FHA domain-containing protein [Polyangiaceae bacterium]